MGTGKESLKTSSTSLPHSSIQCTFSITKSKTLVKSIAVHKCSSPVIWYLQSLDSVFLSNLKFHWKQSEQFIIHIYKTFAFTQDGLTSTATNEILGPRDIPWCCTFRSVWGKVKIISGIGCIWLFMTSHHLNHHQDHTRTVSRVEGELIDGKASVARLPLQHQPERLPHVHRHLGATRLSPMDSFRWLDWTKSVQDFIRRAKLVLICLQKKFSPVQAATLVLLCPAQMHSTPTAGLKQM